MGMETGYVRSERPLDQRRPPRNIALRKHLHGSLVRNVHLPPKRARSLPRRLSLDAGSIHNRLQRIAGDVSASHQPAPVGADGGRTGLPDVVTDSDRDAGVEAGPGRSAISLVV